MRKGRSKPANLREQVDPEAVAIYKESWATSKASDPEHSGPNMRDSAGKKPLPAQAVAESWATPRSGATDNSRPNGKGGKCLGEQVKKMEWGTHTMGGCHTPAFVRDSPMPTEYARAVNGKLNPRWVETLMGLPVGWTMPSCAFPATIVPMNSGSSETGSCPSPAPMPL